MGQLLYVEGLITPVMQPHAIFYIGKTDAASFSATRRRWTQTQTTVNYTDYQSFVLAAHVDNDQTILLQPSKPVSVSIFDNRLQKHRGNQCIVQIRFDTDLLTYTAGKPAILHRQIHFYKFHFIAERDQLHIAAL